MTTCGSAGVITFLLFWNGLEWYGSISAVACDGDGITEPTEVDITARLYCPLGGIWTDGNENWGLELSCTNNDGLGSYIVDEDSEVATCGPPEIQWQPHDPSLTGGLLCCCVDDVVYVTVRLPA